MRLALFGGTFDPIHCGHLRVARAAADAFALDRVLFAPTGRQPLKSEPAIASFEDRMAMAALAIAGAAGCNGERTTDNVQRPPFALTALDAPRPDGRPNYTVDLLPTLAREYPAARLFVLTGADSFLTLRNWRAPDQLLALAEWIVVSRPDFPLTPAFLDGPEFSLTPAQRERIHLLTAIHEDISATALRRLLHESATASARPADPALNPRLPPTVAAYIRDHGLYRS